MQQTPKTVSLNSIWRIRIWYALLLLVCSAVVVRLFYLQVIRHHYYQSAALAAQLKEYEIPAHRGIIEAYDGNRIVPIVLNEAKYTLFADPHFITDAEATGRAVADLIGGDAKEYAQKMTADSRYVILAKKLSESQKNQIDEAAKAEVDRLRGERDAVYVWKGIGTREVPYRTYPQGKLASQLLGFVNDEGEGRYGVEQALDKRLRGTPGLLRAITDASGVPLAANEDNVLVEPKSGERVVLTIDIGMQKQTEDLLKKGLDRAKSKSGSALIMEVKTGAIKAMANYPTYHPGEFFKTEDARLFTNAAVDSPLEVGSVIKPLTAAAAIDLGVVHKDSTYQDPGQYRIDDALVTNVEQDSGAGRRNIKDILQLSLNTGATWLLMRMGDGELNEKARIRWHDYLVNRYRFGQPTGIEQGYEAAGTVPDPRQGSGLNITYANMAFGQGMMTTPLQLASAYAAVLNGGTYYRPTLIDRTIDGVGQETVHQPEVLGKGIVKPSTSRDVQELMEYVMESNHVNYGMPKLRPEYSVGGKTGTAQLAKPEAGEGYYEDRFNGTFVGFVGGNEPQYVIVVRVNTPKISGYAGAKAAAPLFSDLANALMDNFSVTPKQ